MNTARLYINEEEFLFDNLEDAQTVQRLMEKSKLLGWERLGEHHVNYFDDSFSTMVTTSQRHVEDYAVSEQEALKALYAKNLVDGIDLVLTCLQIDGGWMQVCSMLTEKRYTIKISDEADGLELYPIDQCDGIQQLAADYDDEEASALGSLNSILAEINDRK